MAVGFLVLVLYAGLGLLALVSFATLGLIDPMLIVYLIIFYLLAYFTFASMMAAVGSAVNEMREAQSLMMPIMLVLMVPWILWLPLSREPNSMLAVVAQLHPAVQQLRDAAADDVRRRRRPPGSRWVAIAIGAVGVYASVWFAAKVFRVGLLMFGKPPTFGDAGQVGEDELTTRTANGERRLESGLRACKLDRSSSPSSSFSPS